MAKDKPYNGDQWTLARFRSFVMGNLRRARWPVKYKSINKAFVGNGKNPKTGRQCKLHKCSVCWAVLPKSEMVADHIDPVIPLDGFEGEDMFLGYNWNEVIKRLYCEEDNFQAICKVCHKQKTQNERQEREKNK